MKAADVVVVWVPTKVALGCLKIDWMARLSYASSEPGMPPQSPERRLVGGGESGPLPHTRATSGRRPG